MSAYVDPVAVERAVAGQRVRLTRLERRAAAQALSRRGLSARVVAERVGCSSRTVQRHRGRPEVMVSTYGA